MKRSTAKRIHETTNLTYWMENEDWHSGDPKLDLVCKIARALPFSIHKAQKRLFYDTNKLIAVNGESVVARDTQNTVDKFMFRYPDEMDEATFHKNVAHEVGTVTNYLSRIALQTQVSLKPAQIFRNPHSSVNAVAQTQPWLDLEQHIPLRVEQIESGYAQTSRDQTAANLELLLTQAGQLARNHGYYPDIAQSSGNLRSDPATGDVTLIDVMPIYADGGRLINDGARVLPSTQASLRQFEAFVGSYGA